MNNKGSAVLLVCALLFSPLSHAATRWVEVRTADFHVMSAVNQKTTLQVVRDIETYQQVVGTILGLDVHPKIPVTMMLLPGSLYAPHAPPRTVGVIKTDYHSARILVDADNWSEASEIVFHELTHLLLRHSVRQSALPPWFNEGLAEYLSTVRVVNGKAEVGRLAQGRLINALEGNWIPLRRLLTAGYDSPMFGRHSRATYMAYAQSWLLVHYSRENLNRGKQLDQFRGLLGVGVPVEQAFDKAFPGDDGALDTELRGYAKGSRFTYLRFPLKNTAYTTPTLTDLASEKALNELGAWVIDNGNFNDPKEFKFLQNLAAQAAPTSIAALQLAVAHTLRKEFAQGDPMLQAGCSVMPIETRAKVLCGDIHIYRASRDESLLEPQRAPHYEAATSFYLSVLKTEPDHLESLLSMSTMGLEGQDLVDVRAGLERALQRNPHAGYVAFRLAGLYRPNDLVKARRYLQQAAMNTPSFAETRVVMRELREIDEALAVPSEANVPVQ